MNIEYFYSAVKDKINIVSFFESLYDCLHLDEHISPFALVEILLVQAYCFLLLHRFVFRAPETIDPIAIGALRRFYPSAGINKVLSVSPSPTLRISS